MNGTYEVTTVLGREEVLAGRIYRTRTSGSFEYDTSYLRRRPALVDLPRRAVAHGADALTIAVMSSRIDAAVDAVS